MRRREPKSCRFRRWAPPHALCLSPACTSWFQRSCAREPTSLACGPSGTGGGAHAVDRTERCTSCPGGRLAGRAGQASSTNRAVCDCSMQWCRPVADSTVHDSLGTISAPSAMVWARGLHGTSAYHRFCNHLHFQRVDTLCVYLCRSSNGTAILGLHLPPRSTTSSGAPTCSTRAHLQRPPFCKIYPHTAWREASRAGCTSRPSRARWRSHDPEHAPSCRPASWRAARLRGPRSWASWSQGVW
mmetsp:Transcript_43925/g.88571  ORF Transcript_43925/g.88571 Transcript_43925/m.88571 type:complete len:243 (-) Transcript_43925:499-1227(-)